MKHLFLPGSITLALLLAPLCHGATIFSESIGAVAATTAIATHEENNGFDNDALTFSGIGEIRNTSASSGYTGASGLANVFLTSNSTRTFQIDGISTVGHTTGTIGISFGAFKSTIASNMTTLVLEYSTNGIAWTSIPIPSQPTGDGTAIWRLLSLANTSIPISSTLSLRWTNTDADTQYRLDDIQLIAIPEPGALLLSSLGLLALLRRRR